MPFFLSPPVSAGNHRAAAEHTHPARTCRGCFAPVGAVPAISAAARKLRFVRRDWRTRVGRWEPQEGVVNGLSPIEKTSADLDVRPGQSEVDCPLWSGKWNELHLAGSDPAGRSRSLTSKLTFRIMEQSTVCGFSAHFLRRSKSNFVGVTNLS